MSEDSFVAFVEAEAQKLGKVFVLDSGEGRNMENPPEGIDVEDLSGWLLTPAQAETIPHRTRAERDALFDLEELPFCFVIWDTNEEGKLIVKFEEAPMFPD